MKETPDKSGTKSEQSAANNAEGLGRLLGVIAHEIKNPLSTIKVNLRLADEDLHDTASAVHQCNFQASEISPSRDEIENRLARTRRKIAVITKEAGRLEQILDNFLRFADQTHPHLSPADVNAIVSDLFDFFLPQAIAHSITMRQQLHKEPLICKLDTVMLKQALLNLFINAQQALDRQGELMVRTGRDSKPGFAQIQINDTGKGIPADRIGHLFKPYQSTKPEGSGLGLATVKKIIDLHNGSISVVSEPGKGTSFTISLPLHSAGGATANE
jgi:two-component system sensor histidine kinase HydH